MGWLKKTFGYQKRLPKKSPQRNGEIEIETYGRRIVSVPELDMMGQCSSSPNGQFTIIWQDSGWNGDQSNPSGRYVLLEKGKLVVDARMARPQDGKVANNGVFVLNDWGQRNDLAGIFTAFSSDGREIVARSYGANLLNNGLSEDGRLAVCQTCNAPGSPDSSILTVFDLVEGKVISSWTAESGWADSYEFPSRGDQIRMVRREKISLNYSLQGDFLDRKLWLVDEVCGGTLYVIRKALKEDEASTSLTFDMLRDGVQTAISSEDDRFLADALRLLGEIEEAAENPKAALQAYDKALQENPKIGVARKAAALRKSVKPSQR